MLRYINLFLVVITTVSFVNCANPKGATDEEKRDYILKMRDDTLAQLYAEKPETKHLIREAAGYGVFSNISSQLLFFLAEGADMVSSSIIQPARKPI